jgi:hypothetical protein
MAASEGGAIEQEDTWAVHGHRRPTLASAAGLWT